jgi:hypothetical protein
MVGIRALAAFLFAGSLLMPGEAQPDKAEQILAFAQPWIKTADYAWQRESLSRVEGASQPGLRIKDFGRFRVEFVKYDSEAAEFIIHVLQFRFETQLKDGATEQGVSEVEGQRLPPTFLHWALGFSFNAPADYRVQGVPDQQASQILDLLDFRGFVPSETPKPGMQWPLQITPDRGEAFKFKEELTRTFRCEAITPEDKGQKCKIHFDETSKVTPIETGHSWELTEREGLVWITLPDGLVQAAEWKSQATESVGGGKNAGKIHTETQVTLMRVDVPEEKPKAPRPKRIEQEARPLPPR